MLGGVSNFAFSVKTNFVFSTMFPSLRVLGSWVSVPVPGESVVLGVVPFIVGTNENRSGYARYGTAAEVSAVIVVVSSITCVLVTCYPSVTHVHNTKYHIYHEGDGAGVGGEETMVGRCRGYGGHIHIMCVLFSFPYTYMFFARFHLQGGSGALRLP